MEFYPIILDKLEQYAVEEECRAHSCSIKEGLPWSVLCTKIWSSSCFLGECILPMEVQERLHSEAVRVFAKLCKCTPEDLSGDEKRILILDCIRLTQMQDQEEKEGKLWDYLLDNLGYSDTEKRSSSRQTMYKAICKILETQMLLERKLFCEEGMKYYNTLRLHALAPARTISNLFTILYCFYQNNLESQYISSDNSYRIFVQQISKRWRESGSADENLKLPSAALASSFRTLFVSYPNCMAAICDTLVSRIDALLRGNNHELDMTQRWNVLLLQWFDEKTEADRQKMERTTRNARRERVITDQKDIRPSYVLSENKLYLQLPRIRLPEITERPAARLLQDQAEITCVKLSVFGDEFCLTAREYAFCLSDLPQVDWNSFHFSVVITCGDQVIYDAGETLYRPWLLFHASGEEDKHIRRRSGSMYLLAPHCSSVLIADEDMEHTLPCKGQLTEFVPSALRLLLVDGKDLTGSHNKETTCSLEGVPVTDAALKKGNEHYRIFRQPPVLYVRTARPELLKNYYIRQNGEVQTLYPYRMPDCETIAHIPLPQEQNTFCRITVAELAANKPVFTLCYCICPDFSYSFEPPLFPEVPMKGICQLHMNELHIRPIEMELDADQNTVEFPCPWDLSASLELTLPRLRIRLGDQNAFLLPQKLWYTALEREPFVSVSCPPAYSVSLYLIDRIPEKANVFDICGIVRNKKDSGIKIARWGYRVKTEDGSIIQEKMLSDVVFSPTMEGSPILYDGCSITWDPGEAFYGPNDAEFRIFLENDKGEPWEYRAGLSSQCLEKRFPCREGVYRYKVYLCGKRTVFQQQPDILLYTDSIRVIAPEEERYRHADIHLETVAVGTRKWFSAEHLTLPENNGWLTKVRYLGRSVPYQGALPDFQQPVPSYTARLQFQHPDGRMIDYNYTEQSAYFLVNPVTIWFAGREDGKDVLLLARKTGEPMRIQKLDAGLARLLNRIPPDPQNKKYRKADYFTYTVHYH
ncbi:MAG: hypothetical protein IJV58_00940 [Oscillospiraceae bacterium]|nr:hypothetical protein [Oscillospiraceae bacterium]